MPFFVYPLKMSQWLIFNTFPERLESVRGFYIGTQEEWMPVSRESKEYWTRREDAEAALGNGQWTQRPHP